MRPKTVSQPVKFTPKGGRVEAGARLESDDTIVISVADTGLGLPLGKSLLDLHQAGLYVDSAVGVGTTASARFPAQRTIRR